MKKIICLILLVVMVCTLASCSENNADLSTEENESTQDSTYTEPRKIDWNTKETDSPFKYGSFVGSNGTEVIYRIRYGSASNQPLVIWNHGSGAVGEDNEKQLGANDNASGILADYGDDFSVIVAQYPYNFTTPYLDGEKADIDNWLKAYAELIDSLVNSGAVDGKRVYLMGGSMGGGVAMEFVTQYPDRFACVAVMASRGTINGDLSVLDAVIDKPIWLFHVEGDSTNPTDVSDEIYDYLTTKGSTLVKYSRYTSADLEAGGLHPLATHAGAWHLALADEQLYTWMFEQSK